MNYPDPSTPSRMVDVYISDRCIASCPVDPALDKAAAIDAAGAMLKDDGILTDAQLAQAVFHVREHEGAGGSS